MPGQPLGFGLDRVFDRKADVLAGSKQPLKSADVFRRADDQDLTNSCEHERGEGIVHHRLVIDRQ